MTTTKALLAECNHAMALALAELFALRADGVIKTSAAIDRLEEARAAIRAAIRGDESRQKAAAMPGEPRSGVSTGANSQNTGKPETPPAAAPYDDRVIKAREATAAALDAQHPTAAPEAGGQELKSWQHPGEVILTPEVQECLRVQLSVLREQHNTLAGVEEMCTGTVAKLKRYAPLLRKIAKWKAGLRVDMKSLQHRIDISSRSKP